MSHEKEREIRQETNQLTDAEALTDEMLEDAAGGIRRPKSLFPIDRPCPICGRIRCEHRSASYAEREP